MVGRTDKRNQSSNLLQQKALSFMVQKARRCTKALIFDSEQTPSMPADFNGYWKMVSNDNFEAYLKALDVNIAVRKIANMLKPDKEIIQDGDHMIIKTLSTFKNYIMDFDIGKEFEEDLTGVDDRKCMTCVTWDEDKLVCVQKGEKEGRGWTQWIEGDEMHLEIRACGVKCKQVFKKVQ
ncbi:retinol-binding protein 1 isoform X1 [Pogona vitticeps]